MAMRTGVVGQMPEVAGYRRWQPAIPLIAVDASKLLAIWVLCVTPALFASSRQYTWSLLIFVAPIVLTGRELSRAGALAALFKPVAYSLGLLVPMGGVLTLALADDFFTYPTASATLGLTIPALDLDGVDRAFQIPVEELLFYFFGFTSLLMLYAWVDVVMLPSPRAAARRVEVSWVEILRAMGGGLALSAAGVLVQRVANPGAHLPGYWIYLMMVPVPVMLALGPTAASRINWPALMLVCLALWGHSIVWEVTLAIPQGWWGYQAQSMLGLHIEAWHGLPIEAVAVWLMTPLAGVISFEALRARLSPFGGRAP
jgi:hypothetical protein